MVEPASHESIDVVVGALDEGRLVFVSEEGVQGVLGFSLGLYHACLPKYLIRIAGNLTLVIPAYCFQY